MLQLELHNVAVFIPVVGMTRGQGIIRVVVVVVVVVIVDCNIFFLLVQGKNVYPRRYLASLEEINVL